MFGVRSKSIHHVKTKANLDRERRAAARRQKSAVETISVFYRTYELKRRELMEEWAVTSINNWMKFIYLLHLTVVPLKRNQHRQFRPISPIDARTVDVLASLVDEEFCEEWFAAIEQGNYAFHTTLGYVKLILDETRIHNQLSPASISALERLLEILYDRIFNGLEYDKAMSVLGLDISPANVEHIVRYLPVRYYTHPCMFKLLIGKEATTTPEEDIIRILDGNEVSYPLSPSTYGYMLTAAMQQVHQNLTDLLEDRKQTQLDGFPVIRKAIILELGSKYCVHNLIDESILQTALELLLRFYERYREANIHIIHNFLADLEATGFVEALYVFLYVEIRDSYYNNIESMYKVAQYYFNLVLPSKWFKVRPLTFKDPHLGLLLSVFVSHPTLIDVSFRHQFTSTVRSTIATSRKTQIADGAPVVLPLRLLLDHAEFEFYNSIVFQLNYLCQLIFNFTENSDYDKTSSVRQAQKAIDRLISSMIWVSDNSEMILDNQWIFGLIGTVAQLANNHQYGYKLACNIKWEVYAIVFYLTMEICYIKFHEIGSAMLWPLNNLLSVVSQHGICMYPPLCINSTCTSEGLLYGTNALKNPDSDIHIDQPDVLMDCRPEIAASDVVKMRGLRVEVDAGEVVDGEVERVDWKGILEWKEDDTEELPSMNSIQDSDTGLVVVPDTYVSLPKEYLYEPVVYQSNAAPICDEETKNNHLNSISTGRTGLTEFTMDPMIGTMPTEPHVVEGEEHISTDTPSMDEESFSDELLVFSTGDGPIVANTGRRSYRGTESWETNEPTEAEEEPPDIKIFPKRFIGTNYHAYLAEFQSMFDGLNRGIHRLSYEDTIMYPTAIRCVVHRSMTRLYESPHLITYLTNVIHVSAAFLGTEMQHKFAQAMINTISVLEFGPSMSEPIIVNATRGSLIASMAPKIHQSTSLRKWLVTFTSELGIEEMGQDEGGLRREAENDLIYALTNVETGDVFDSVVNVSMGKYYIPTSTHEGMEGKLRLYRLLGSLIAGLLPNFVKLDIPVHPLLMDMSPSKLYEYMNLVDSDLCKNLDVNIKDPDSLAAMYDRSEYLDLDFVEVMVDIKADLSLPDCEICQGSHKRKSVRIFGPGEWTSLKQLMRLRGKMGDYYRKVAEKSYKSRYILTKAHYLMIVPYTALMDGMKLFKKPLRLGLRCKFAELLDNDSRFTADDLLKMISHRHIHDELMDRFRNVLRRLDDSYLRKLLKFWTGSSIMGLNTANTLQLAVSRPGDFPSANTCNLILHIPDDIDEDEIYRKLIMALDSSSGFWFI